MFVARRLIPLHQQPAAVLALLPWVRHLLYADDTILWRCALPRAGWWRTAPHARRPTRPLSQRPINHEEALKRDAWRRYRPWSQITSGVVLSIIGQARLRLQFWPARAGHHLNPIAGFWRVLQDKLGAGRCFPDFQQLYWRVRRVLRAHHEQPIYACRW